MAPPGTPDLKTFLATLIHPHRAEIFALRDVILQADGSIKEAVKWNAPSFYTTEHFATMNLRDKLGVGVIMHFGAKKREINARSLIADPGGLLTWLADDRATVSFRDMAEIVGKRDSYSALVREWLRYV